MFEYIPNEIILQIFSYLELTELHKSFSCLNFRFEYLLYNNFTPLYARLTSKESLPLEKFYHRINNLSLIEWIPNDVLILINKRNLSQLKSLSIKSTNNLYFGQSTNELIHQILSLPSLSKCRINLSPTLYILDKDLPTSSSIKSLTLSMITLDMLFSLLIHVPKLRTLDVWLNSNGRIFDSHTYNQFYCCLNLKNVTIGLHNDIKFEEILFLLPRMPILYSLKIYGSVWDQEFLNEHHWKNIITGENLFPLLNKLNLNISIRCRDTRHTNSVLRRFKNEFFRRTNFFVTFDLTVWFYLTCLWNH